MKQFVLAGFCAALLLGAPAAKADETSAFETFKKTFSAAAAIGDAEALRALEYPAQAATEPKYKEFQDWQLQKDALLRIPAEATYKIEPAAGPAFAGMGFVYPVTPTHSMQVDYKVNEYSSKTVVRELFYDSAGDKFFVVAPLPDDAMLAAAANK